MENEKFLSLQIDPREQTKSNPETKNNHNFFATQSLSIIFFEIPPFLYLLNYPETESDNNY